jgi:hypothetical protein
MTAPLLFLDIETAPIPAADPLWLEYVHARGVSQDEAEKLRLLTPLDPMLGRVVCIGVAGIADGDVPEVLTGDEADLLAGLGDALRGLRITLVGHNVRGFDVPFLAVRARCHRMHGLARDLAAATLIDTRDLWPRVEHYGAPPVPTVRGVNGASLPSICRALGLAHPGDTITGADVATAWEAGDRASVIDHCRADVERVRDVYRILCH